MIYTILAQRWPGATTYYGQLERIQADGVGGFVTLFKCQHRHRTRDGAAHCPDVTGARTKDRDSRIVAGAMCVPARRPYPVRQGG